MSRILLEERFGGTSLDSRLEWHNRPRAWRLQTNASALIVEPEGNTDFWQRTHYGFQADNGHFLGLTLEGDFAITTQVKFFPVHQYDQAGLMIRADETCWIKASVEHELEGPPQLGAVVTNNGYSDWSMQDFPLATNEVRLRLSKCGLDVKAEFGAVTDDSWKPLRIAHLHCPENQELTCGLYACCPNASGFRAEFALLEVSSE